MSLSLNQRLNRGFSSMTFLFPGLIFVCFWKIKDKMKTKVDPRHIYDRRETEIDRDHNPLLCLLPSSSTIPSPQRNMDIPVPAGPAPPPLYGLHVHRSTGTGINPSGNNTEWLLNVTDRAYTESPRGGPRQRFQPCQHQCNTRTRRVTIRVSAPGPLITTELTDRQLLVKQPDRVMVKLGSQGGGGEGVGEAPRGRIHRFQGQCRHKPSPKAVCV